MTREAFVPIHPPERAQTIRGRACVKIDYSGNLADTMRQLATADLMLTGVLARFGFTACSLERAINTSTTYYHTYRWYLFMISYCCIY